MAKFQCLRTLVAELNSLENHLFLANVTMPAAELDERLEVMTVPQVHWLSDQIGSAFSHYFSSYAIEWGCQPVAFMTAAMVAPCFRWSIANT